MTRVRREHAHRVELAGSRRRRHIEDLIVEPDTAVGAEHEEVEADRRRPPAPSPS
jgi:hypothetical protein